MSNIADKIARIIAKAESTTSPAEAEAFMAKAHAMMEAEGLSMLDVGKLESDDPIGAEEEVAHYFAAESYLKYVGSSLARYYGCEVMFEQVGRNKYAFGVAGRESARVTFRLMFPFVAKQIRQLAAAGVKAGDFPTKSKAQTRIGNALAHRIHAMVRANEDRRKEDLPGKGLNALVPVDMIEAAFEERWPNLKYKKGRATKTSSAGRDYANRVSLNHQTGSAGAPKQIG